MKFFTSILALASAAIVYADQPNPFTSTTAQLQTSAGSTVNITWTPTTQGTVSLLLRYGNSAFLNSSGTIASSLPNNGQYTWRVPSDIVRGSSYALEIVSDSDPSEVNYSGQFLIDSPVLTASSGATSLVASATGSASGTTSGSTVVVTTSSSASGSASSSASGSGSTSSSAASTTSNTSTAASAGVQTTSGTGAAAPRATAMAGMLGFVALGALAL